MDSSIEVVALGHAIVDVLAPSEDSLVAGFGLEKGTMTLIDDEQSEKIYASLGPATEASGGSAANTAACLASFGAAVEFTGKVREDGLGRVFTHDIRAAGVKFNVPAAPQSSSGPGTGRCLIMVTPDAEKTMCTNLGIGAFLGADDIDATALQAARLLYIEGYLCGKEESEAGLGRAVALAREAGVKVAFSASDPAWVQLQKTALVRFLDHVDILFANEMEAYGLSDTDDIDSALAVLTACCPTVAVTLGGRGSVVASAGSDPVWVPAAPVDHVVDTTGAGDSYAAGFLFGVVRALGPQRSAELGALAAAEIVSHLGARPLHSLAALAEEAGLQA